MSPTRRCIGASSSSCERWTRLGLNWKGRSNSTNGTSKLDSRAASATVRRAPVVCPRADVVEEKPPVFVLVDRRANDCYVLPAKSAEESKVRLLLVVGEQESVTVYTDRFRAYDPLGRGGVRPRMRRLRRWRIREWEREHARCLQRQAHTLLQSVSASSTRPPESRQGSTRNHPRNRAMTPAKIAYS